MNNTSSIYTITGATGLVGGHLCLTLLAKGHAIKAMASSPGSVQKIRDMLPYYSDVNAQLLDNIEWHYGDIADQLFVDEFIAGSKCVFHCAGLVNFHPRAKHRVQEVNYAGTRNIVNACLHHAIDRLVHVSSVAAVGKMVNNGLITEDDKWPLAKGSTYAWSKTNAELEVWRGFYEGLNGIIVNPSIILGPGVWNEGSIKLFTRIMQGLKYYPSGGTGFVDVHDVVKALIWAMEETNGNHERFILNASNLTYREFFQMVITKANLKGTPKPIHNAFLCVLSALTSIGHFLGFKGGIPLENARSARRKVFYSSEKYLSISKLKFIDIENTLDELIQAFRMNYQKP